LDFDVTVVSLTTMSDPSHVEMLQPYLIAPGNAAHEMPRTVFESAERTGASTGGVAGAGSLGGS
jgi:hypothetical protein